MRYHRVHDGRSCGIIVYGEGSQGRMERCELWGNAIGGLLVRDGGDPTLAACTIRDHAAGSGRGSGCGVYVHSSAFGKGTVEADCIFVGNAGGDVVRDPSAPMRRPPALPRRV